MVLLWWILRQIYVTFLQLEQSTEGNVNKLYNCYVTGIMFKNVLGLFLYELWHLSGGWQTIGGSYASASFFFRIRRILQQGTSSYATVGSYQYLHSFSSVCVWIKLNVTKSLFEELHHLNIQQFTMGLCKLGLWAKDLFFLSVKMLTAKFSYKKQFLTTSLVKNNSYYLLIPSFRKNRRPSSRRRSFSASRTSPARVSGKSALTWPLRWPEILPMTTEIIYGQSFSRWKSVQNLLLDTCSPVSLDSNVEDIQVKWISTVVSVKIVRIWNLNCPDSVLGSRKLY